MNDYLSFHLPDSFIDQYKDVKPNWGFQIGGGNTIGEITFLTKYSRLKEDGSKERWYEVCKRVVEGYYSILKDHCVRHRTPWIENKAQAAAKDAYDRMFAFKWLPPGRGLWAMGTPLVNEDQNSGPLFNCSFVSTGNISSRSTFEATRPFQLMAEMSMNGIGVGFDTLGAGRIELHEPVEEKSTWVVPDSREGWAEAFVLLLESYFFKNRKTIEFDYSEVRPAGAPIKRFGGTASGPGPLSFSLEKIRELLHDRSGDKLTSRDIADIMNLIGKAVVAGNTRRSAQIALGSIEDKDFISLKDWNMPENFERMAYDGSGWGGLSNNTVALYKGESASSIVESIAVNGEPGVYHIDLAKDYGRMIDGPNYKDSKVAGLNPCVTADTWVMTSAGARQVQDLIGKKFKAIVDGKEYGTVSDGFWKTGDKQVFELRLVDGQRLKLTADHRVLAINEMGESEWVEAGRLEIGQRVVIHDHSLLETWGENTLTGSKLGYLVGHLLGDGSLSKTSNNATLAVWESDPGHGSVQAYITQCFDLLYAKDAVWNHDAGSDRIRMNSAELGKAARAYVTNDKKILDSVEKESSTFCQSFLKGWFDSDGHIEGHSTEGGVSVRLSSVQYENLEIAQRMLARFGIKSSIRNMHVAAARTWSDGNTYQSQESFRLVISGASAQKFMDIVGFIDSAKVNKWFDRTSNMARGFYRKPYEVAVEDFTKLGIEPVYDVTVDEVHAFDANGIYVHNCAEATLEDCEFCNLSEIFPHHHEDVEDFKATIKHAYLYCKAVTLLPTPWPETNEVITRNRRIGTSISGIVQFTEMRSWHDLRQWADAGYRAIEGRDKQFSEWLGIRESIKTTVIKPSGTVSLLCGATPGVHWPVAAGGYVRRQRFAKIDPIVNIFREAGYNVEDDVSNDTSVVVEFYTQGPEIRNEREVSVWEKVSLAVLLQRYWADQAVSATFTFRPDEQDQIAQIVSAYGDQLKSLSFLPLGEDMAAGAYPQMPYEAVDQDWFDAKFNEVKTLNFDKLYNGLIGDVDAEKFCTNDSCEI